MFDFNFESQILQHTSSIIVRVIFVISNHTLENKTH